MPWKKSSPNWRTAEHPGYRSKKEEARGGTRRAVARERAGDALKEGLVKFAGRRVTPEQAAALRQAEEIKDRADKLKEAERLRKKNDKAAKAAARKPEPKRAITAKTLREQKNSRRASKRRR